MSSSLLGAALAVSVLVAPGTVLATDRAEVQLSAVPAPVASDAMATETIAIAIRSGSEELWSGTLRIGGRSGNGSFSISKNEAAEPCPGEPISPRIQYSTSHRLNFSMSRRNYDQEPNAFYINVNWVRPLPACEGQGSDTFGFNRVVDIEPGHSFTVEGAGGLKVKLTRQP